MLSKLRRLVEGLVIVVPSDACRPCLPLKGVRGGPIEEICPVLGKDVNDPDDKEGSIPPLTTVGDTGDSMLSAGVVGSDPDCA